MASEKRRMQNRLNQRRYRTQMKLRIQKLEYLLHKSPNAEPSLYPVHRSKDSSCEPNMSANDEPSRELHNPTVPKIQFQNLDCKLDFVYSDLWKSWSPGKQIPAERSYITKSLLQLEGRPKVEPVKPKRGRPRLRDNSDHQEDSTQPSDFKAKKIALSLQKQNKRLKETTMELKHSLANKRGNDPINIVYNDHGAPPSMLYATSGSASPISEINLEEFLDAAAPMHSAYADYETLYPKQEETWGALAFPSQGFWHEQTTLGWDSKEFSYPEGPSFDETAFVPIQPIQHIQTGQSIEDKTSSSNNWYPTAPTTPISLKPFISAQFSSTPNFQQLPLPSSYAYTISTFTNRLVRSVHEKGWRVLTQGSTPPSELHRVFWFYLRHRSRASLHERFRTYLNLKGSAALIGEGFPAELQAGDGKRTWIAVSEIEAFLKERGFEVPEDRVGGFGHGDGMRLLGPSFLVGEEKERASQVPQGAQWLPVSSNSFEGPSWNIDEVPLAAFSSLSDSTEEKVLEQRQGNLQQSTESSPEAEYGFGASIAPTFYPLAYYLDIDRFLAELVEIAICLGRTAGFPRAGVNVVLNRSLVKL